MSETTHKPAYLVEAISFKNTAEANYRKVADELEALDGLDDPRRLEVIERLADAHNVCLIADDRCAQAWARWQVEKAELPRSITRNPTARKFAPNYSHFHPSIPPANTVILEDRNASHVQTAGAIQHA